MIRFKDVNLSYDNQQVLKQANFQIPDGEFVLLTGKSGAGKTSIINMILGAVRPDSGQVIVNKIEVNTLSQRNLQLYRRVTIGVIFQDYKLLAKRTVFENIAFALEVCGTHMHEIEKRTKKVLKLVNLENVASKFPHQLSGGEQQRVAIARAIIHEPKILIADEPTGNLDDENTAEVIKMLKTINKRGTTVILATHDSQIVNNLHQRVLNVAGGKVN